MFGFSQNDSILDTVVRTPWHLKPVSAGIAVFSGNAQYFEGYNQQLMYADAQSGLTLYPDWAVYSSLYLLPEYFAGGFQFNFADTSKKFRLRLGMTYYYRKDSMAYRSGFAVNDTIYGRDGSEECKYAGVGIGLNKYSKRILKIIRLHCGANVEASFASRSKIVFNEFAYDFGDEKILDLQTFNVRGRARVNLFGSAMVGVEVLFAKKFYLQGEVHSGIGIHWLPRERAFGFSKNLWSLGSGWYFN